MRLWSTCDKKQLQRHLREYERLDGRWRGTTFEGIVYRMGILTNLIIQIKEAIKDA